MKVGGHHSDAVKEAIRRARLGYRKQFCLRGHDTFCKKHSSEFTKQLHVDHCHKTGKIRGLLCYHCNVAVGFYENTELNSKIKAFLEEVL